MQLAVLKNNEAVSQCQQCGGRCCKAYPAGASPEQFGANTESFRENITKALKSGKWALDCWEGDIPDHHKYSAVYYIRPAIKGYEGEVVDKSFGGECTNLTPDGCSLSFKERPYGCQALIPNFVNGSPDCHFTWGDKFRNDKHWAAVQWRPFQKILTSIMRKLSPVDLYE